MNFRIEKMNHQLTYIGENKKAISFNGYAFINTDNNMCMIIAYGESRRDSIIKYFNELGDRLVT